MVTPLLFVKRDIETLVPMKGGRELYTEMPLLTEALHRLLIKTISGGMTTTSYPGILCWGPLSPCPTGDGSIVRISIALDLHIIMQTK